MRWGFVWVCVRIKTKSWYLTSVLCLFLSLAASYHSIRNYVWCKTWQFRSFDRFLVVTTTNAPCNRLVIELLNACKWQECTSIFVLLFYQRDVRYPFEFIFLFVSAVLWILVVWCCCSVLCRFIYVHLRCVSLMCCLSGVSLKFRCRWHSKWIEHIPALWAHQLLFVPAEIVRIAPHSVLSFCFGSLYDDYDKVSESRMQLKNGH